MDESLLRGRPRCTRVTRSSRDGDDPIVEALSGAPLAHPFSDVVVVQGELTATTRVTKAMTPSVDTPVA